ncbi:hypothetical protein Tco_0234587, partial [Tanacetum coccineum]
DILQICPRVGNKKFVEPPLEKEILIFLASLGHSGDIRKITDVNINKLHQPWRSFAVVINKCLSGTPSYDSLRLSQAQILWGAYEADKILLDTYGDTVTIKRPRDGADDDQEPSAGTDRGSKRRRSGKEPASTSAPSETTTKMTHNKSASQSAPVEEAMQTIDVFIAEDEQAEEEVQHLPDWFQQPTRLPSPDHA